MKGGWLSIHTPRTPTVNGESRDGVSYSTHFQVNPARRPGASALVRLVAKTFRSPKD